MQIVLLIHREGDLVCTHENEEIYIYHLCRGYEEQLDDTDFLNSWIHSSFKPSSSMFM